MGSASKKELDIYLDMVYCKAIEYEVYEEHADKFVRGKENRDVSVSHKVEEEESLVYFRIQYSCSDDEGNVFFRVLGEFRYEVKPMVPLVVNDGGEKDLDSDSHKMFVRIAFDGIRGMVALMLDETSYEGYAVPILEIPEYKS